MAGRTGSSPSRERAPRGQIDLVFDNNRLASALYGEFDQNLALVERRLGVDARARGNMVTLAGTPTGLALARRVLESLYDRLLEGHQVGQADVEGAIRMAEAEEAQLPLPTLDDGSRMRLARIADAQESRSSPARPCRTAISAPWTARS
jgi:phosphate starvation-inducible PhoH-like protein